MKELKWSNVGAPNLWNSWWVCPTRGRTATRALVAPFVHAQGCAYQCLTCTCTRVPAQALWVHAACLCMHAHTSVTTGHVPFCACTLWATCVHISLLLPFLLCRQPAKVGKLWSSELGVGKWKLNLNGAYCLLLCWSITVIKILIWFSLFQFIPPFRVMLQG